MRNIKFHDERKQEIITVAKDLFLEHGIEHTTITMIVNKIGVAHGLLYYYFKSKDELVESVLESILCEFKAGLKSNLDCGNTDFYMKVAILAKALYEVYYKNDSVKRQEEWIRIYYHDQVTQALASFGKVVLEEGIRKGYLTVPNPELILEITLGGSMLLLEKHKITCDKLIVIVFQMLGIPKGEETAKRILA